MSIGLSQMSFFFSYATVRPLRQENLNPNVEVKSLTTNIFTAGESAQRHYMKSAHTSMLAMEDFAMLHIFTQ